MFPTFAHLVGQELRIALRTRRLWLLLGVFMLAALVSAAAVTRMVEGIQAVVVEQMSTRGVDPTMAQEVLARAWDDGVDEVMGLLGMDLAAIAGPLRRCPPVALFLWLGQLALPLATLLLTAPIFAAELGQRSFCYVTLRYPRGLVALARLTAQWLSLVVALGLAGLVFTGWLAWTLSPVHGPDALVALAFTTAMLSLSALVWVGFAGLCSVMVRSTGAALGVGVAGLLAIGIWRLAVAGMGLDASMSWLTWPVPGTWALEVWRSDPARWWGGVIALLVLGAALQGAAVRRFQTRDLA